MLGISFSRHYLFKESMICYDAILKVFPKDIETLNNKGNLLSRMDENTESIKFYDLVLKQNPKQIHALYNKGCSLMKLERLSESKKCFDAVLKMDSQYPDARELRTKIENVLKLEKRGEKLLKKAQLNINDGIKLLICIGILLVCVAIGKSAQWIWNKFIPWFSKHWIVYCIILLVIIISVIGLLLWLKCRNKKR
jgi:tetratricopeptide (TPR) repeat protein